MHCASSFAFCCSRYSTALVALCCSRYSTALVASCPPRTVTLIGLFFSSCSLVNAALLWAACLRIGETPFHVFMGRSEPENDHYRYMQTVSKFVEAGYDLHLKTTTTGISVVHMAASEGLSK